MASATLNIRGLKLRTQTQRRYIVAVGRTEPFVGQLGTYPPFVRVHKRSDSLDTARRERRRYGNSGPGCFTTVVDTVTGAEVT